MIIALFRHAWRWLSQIEFVKLCVLSNAELRIPTFLILLGLSALYPFLLLICLLNVTVVDRAVSLGRWLVVSRIHR